MLSDLWLAGLFTKLEQAPRPLARHKQPWLTIRCFAVQPLIPSMYSTTNI